MSGVDPQMSAWEKRKMYQPPLKGHEIPSNNPFYNRAFSANVRAKTLNNWTKHANTKRIKDKMQSRITYL